jgi:hypothetical protein
MHLSAAAADASGAPRRRRSSVFAVGRITVSVSRQLLALLAGLLLHVRAQLSKHCSYHVQRVLHAFD